MKFKYWFRLNKREVVTFVSGVVGYLISYFIFKNQELVLLINVLITLIVTTVLIYLKAKEKDFYFVSLSKRSDKDEWLGDGTFEYDKTCDGYVITNTFLGFIFSKCLIWSDYKLEFDAKILKTSIGVNLRAINLSNFVMLQFFEEGIRSHVWTNGLYKVWEPSENKLIFKKNLSLSTWYKFSVTCDKRKIYVNIFDRSANSIFDGYWEIPSGSIDLQAPIANGGIVTYMKFPINLEYGTIGFRNYDTEKAIVRNVVVQKI